MGKRRTIEEGSVACLSSIKLCIICYRPNGQSSQFQSAWTKCHRTRKYKWFRVEYILSNRIYEEQYEKHKENVREFFKFHSRFVSQRVLNIQISCKIALSVGCTTSVCVSVGFWQGGIAKLYQKHTRTHSLEQAVRPKQSAILYERYRSSILILSGNFYFSVNRPFKRICSEVFPNFTVDCVQDVTEEEDRTRHVPEDKLPHGPYRGTYNCKLGRGVFFFIRARTL